MYERRREASFGKCGETENWDGDLPLCAWIGECECDWEKDERKRTREPRSSACEEVRRTIVEVREAYMWGSLTGKNGREQ